MSQSISIAMQQLKYADSALPELRERLRRSRRAQKAVEFLADRDNAERYRCVEDWILCSCLDQYEKDCQAYYEDDERPRLVELVSTKTLCAIDRFLVNALAVAIRLHEQELQVTWGRIVTLTKEETDEVSP